MGMFDDIEIGDRSGQVKCWDCSLHLYRQGDRVPDLDGVSTYSIAMREGGYVNVIDGVLSSWGVEPTCLPVFDKYGAPYDHETAGGLLGEGYTFESADNEVKG